MCSPRCLRLLTQYNYPQFHHHVPIGSHKKKLNLVLFSIRKDTLRQQRKKISNESKSKLFHSFLMDLITLCLTLNRLFGVANLLWCFLLFGCFNPFPTLEVKVIISISCLCHTFQLCGFLSVMTTNSNNTIIEQHQHYQHTWLLSSA